MTNPIADPLVEVTDTDAESRFVDLDATPEGVAFVTITRAARRNAFNAEVIAALHEAFETLQGAEGVRVVFVRGAGGTFSAGADLEWMRDAAEHTEADNRDDAMQMAKMLKSLWDIPALTVALVEGGAYGGGAGLAAACDMAIATADAKFSFSEVRLGIIAATISPYVVAAIGPRNARALFATGKVFDAAHAEKVGLVSEIVADAAALDAAREAIAREMMACGPIAVAESKKLVEDVAYRPVEEVMEETARRIARARVSEEGQEGVRAFLEKRKPSWLA
ncbi:MULTISPECIES: enoyl-CoA hydratase-related protein [Phenylobacterium]|uniref:Methylglutaconyl-CoA hydratase n=1 Tax=Phenylobacterium koreense TaxID=266125 RepID=A0ABV2EL73_9CAUL